MRAEQEVAVLDAQLVSLRDDMDDTQTRSIVSETPLADFEYQDARRHHDVIERERRRLLERIAELRQARDDLLDKLL